MITAGRSLCGPGCRRGSAMIIAVLLSFLVFASGTFALMVSTQSARGAGETWAFRQALLTAEAGIARSIDELNSGEDADGDGLGNLPATSFGSGTYTVTATPFLSGYRIRSQASVGKYTRVIEVTAFPGVQFGAVAAMSLFGAADGAEFEIDPAESKFVQVNGLPAKLPAITVEDPAVYSRIMDQLSQQLADGEISSTTLKGTPMVPWTAPDGTPVQLPVTQSSSTLMNGRMMETLRRGILEQVSDVWVPNADYTFTDDQDITTNMSFGSASDPKVVVFDGRDVDIRDGGKLSGYGTLIIRGGLEIEDRGTLDWTGDVIVISDEDDAEFENQRGQVHVTGNVLVVGGSGGKAEFRVDDPSDGGKQISHTNIQGSVVVLSGGADEEAEVEIEEGTTQIFGLLIVAGGEEVEFELENDRDGSPFNGVLDIIGAAAVGVTAPGGELEVELEGRINLIYNRRNVTDALNSLNRLAGKLYVPLPYIPTSWREVK